MASREDLCAADPSNSSFMDHVLCSICLEILNQPVQCQRNEHYFCKLCITKHLKQSQKCPLCMEKLTMKTLRPPSRVVADLLSQFKVPRCNNVCRGCKEVVKLEDLPLHHAICGFAAVGCSNEGCGETVARKELSSHEVENCKFRKVKCEVCEEKMMYRDYEMHRCFMRKEMDEMKSCLTEITNRLELIQTQNQIMQVELNEHGDFIRHLQDPLSNVTPSSLIFIAGGFTPETKMNFEVFNWSTKEWILYENVLFFSHHNSCSVAYKNKIMVCGGGENLSRIECLNIKEDPKTSLAFPVSLPNYCHSSVKGVLSGYRLLTFQNSLVHEVVLESPRSDRKLVSLGEQKQFYGVEYVNHNIVIVGGEKIQEGPGKSWEVVDDVLLFDPSKNTIRKLAPLPYKVSKMATVPYQDNIVIVGGKGENGGNVSSVVMYNVASEECKRLPSMLQRRSRCAAVILAGCVIVVMGGRKYENTPNDALTSVEYLVIGHDSWNKLPRMHFGREGATASVQV